MKHRLFVGAAALAMAAASAAQTWATANAKNPDSGNAIVYRYLKELPSGFDKAVQPDRFIIAWKYEGERGMPTPTDRQRMDAMEDALEATDVGGQRIASDILGQTHIATALGLHSRVLSAGVAKRTLGQGSHDGVMHPGIKSVGGH